MYLFFQDTAGNVSEAYPGCIHIRNISDTNTPPPRSIRVTESFTEENEWISPKWNQNYLFYLLNCPYWMVTYNLTKWISPKWNYKDLFVCYIISVSECEPITIQRFTAVSASQHQNEHPQNGITRICFVYYFIHIGMWAYDHTKVCCCQWISMHDCHMIIFLSDSLDALYSLILFIIVVCSPYNVYFV